MTTQQTTPIVLRAQPTSYDTFLQSKPILAGSTGFSIDLASIHPALYDFQALLVQWALRKGRTAIFADTGLGKTIQQLEWARHLPGPTLIVAPLSVAEQTIAEAAKHLHLTVRYVRSKDAMDPTGISITNYDMLKHFIGVQCTGIVLDESSVLASLDGVTKTMLIERFAHIPYRLCCSATPAPNDIEELANHAAFLGVMTREQTLSTFFVHDDDGWRLRGYARASFYAWVASWAMAIKRPEDLHCDGTRFILPPLRYTQHVVTSNWRKDGFLFAGGLSGITDRSQVRQRTVTDRVICAVDIIRAAQGQVVAWCGLNAESAALAAALGDDAAELTGSQSREEKLRILLAFLAGDVRVLVTKPKIAGRGLNLQCAHTQVFIGLSDCYDEKTEILTKRGWLTFEKVTREDEVATVNHDTLELEWQRPSRVIWQRYDGPMLHFSGQRNFDLLVTPNHKLFVQRCPLRFPNGDTAWHLKNAEDIAGRYRRQEYRMLSAPHPKKDLCRDIRIPIPLVGYTRTHPRHRIVSTMPVDDFMRLAGWYLSEGYCRPIDSPEAGRIVICQVQETNRQEIIALLKRTGLHVNTKRKDITAYSKNLAAFLLESFGSTSGNKHIPRWVKDLPVSCLIILRDTMIRGDGCHHPGKTLAHSYITISPQLADDFQELCLLTGIRASVKWRHYENAVARYSPRGFFDVTLAHQNLTPSVAIPPVTVPYHGMVGCVTVPNHTVIVRRNGIPVVSGNSWQDYYQCTRRLWRYGQQSPVDTHIIVSDHETAILDNVQRKEQEAMTMTQALIDASRDAFTAQPLTDAPMQMATGTNWALVHGDCVDAMQAMPAHSVDLSVFSPPFMALYQYTGTVRDVGNSKSQREFFRHFKFVSRNLLRVTKPGRLCAMHLSQVPAMQVRDGYIGMRDFRGPMIAHMGAQGWIYHGEVVIQKNPQAQAIRIRAKGLAFMQLEKDAAWMRPALADMILLFRAPGDNAVPVKPECTREEWISWAHPVWFDIRETHTLNAAEGRDNQDDRHIHPLQLCVIERCIRLWSNRGECIFDPFAGIGSTGYVALMHGRKSVGVELKESYWHTAQKNYRRALLEQTQGSLFSTQEVTS